VIKINIKKSNVKYLRTMEYIITHVTTKTINTKSWDLCMTHKPVIITNPLVQGFDYPLYLYFCDPPRVILWILVPKFFESLDDPFVSNRESPFSPRFFLGNATNAALCASSSFWAQAAQ
jgi:hypothetical protein